MKKLKSVKKSTNKKYIFIAALSVLAAVGYIIYRSLLAANQVALITGDPFPGKCTSKLSTFDAKVACSDSGFKEYTFTCKDGTKPALNTEGACLSFEEAYNRASAICGTECIAYTAKPRPSCVPLPTCPEGRACHQMLPKLPEGQVYCPSASRAPIQSPSAPFSPKPSPSLRPSPSPRVEGRPITCKLVTYKKAGDMDGWSNDQIIDPANASVKIGEQLAYAIELNNSNNFPVSGQLKLWNTSLNGSSEPVHVRSWGGLCELDNTTKTVQCTKDAVTISANSTKVSPADVLPSMTVSYQALVPKDPVLSTGTFFQGSIGGQQFDCSPATSVRIVREDEPAITPTPSPKPGCYWQEPRFCIQMLGYKCRQQMVCPTPAPTATARPTPTATPQPPSPLLSCETEVYRVPSRLLRLSTSASLASYKVHNPSSVVFRSGETYAFNVKLTGTKAGLVNERTRSALTLKVAANNSLGANAPYSISHAGSFCNTNFPDKSMKCEVPRLVINPGETVTPDTFMVADIGKVGKQATETTLSYAVSYGNGTVNCPPVTFKVAPNRIQKCYGRWPLRFCRSIED